MTKAGKVRNATPRIEPKPKKRPAPRIRSREKYVRLLERKSVTSTSKWGWVL